MNKNLFFEGSRPGYSVTHGSTTFDLPILYLRDDFFGLYYSIDKKKATAIMPSDKMHPITLPNGRAVIAIMAYNYIDTSIGHYGEIAAAIPTLYNKRHRRFMGFLPLLQQGAHPHFGALVQHLPVTLPAAYEAGRGEWGYTKFVTNMHFDTTPEHQEVNMYEEGEHILDMRVMKRGFHMKDHKPITTFSVKENNLIKTVIPQKGVQRISPKTKGSFIKFGIHPMAKSIIGLDIAEKPFLQTFYTERAAILPSGTVVEKDVRSFEGYKPAAVSKGKHTNEYTQYGI